MLESESDGAMLFWSVGSSVVYAVSGWMWVFGVDSTDGPMLCELMYGPMVGGLIST